MIEKIHETPMGDIHYWTNKIDKNPSKSLIFLPGLTADHRLFDKQVEYFKDKYKVLVRDAPGHGKSYPFRLQFDLFDQARWLDEILAKEEIKNPILIGQSMGGFLSEVYAEIFPQKISGLIKIDSPPIKRKYYTSLELSLLKNMEGVYKYYPRKAILASVPKKLSKTEYGQKLMYDMMMEYDGNKERYTALVGTGFRIMAESIERNLPYDPKCPYMVIFGRQDEAGSCLRYIKAYENDTRKPVEWIDRAGHNANTDKPDIVNALIDKFIRVNKVFL
jgi:pimeloyl-ACP methyl ester carboxylesterase